MEKDRVKLKHGWKNPLNNELELSVPGISGTIRLIQECWCVDCNYDEDEGEVITTARKDCMNCNETGIETTNNGDAIYNFMCYMEEKKLLRERSLK